jgi:DNA-directed RNA polymerase specialized sigma24 family protein
VNGLAYRLLGGDSDLDDLVQESFAQALTCLNRLQNTETFATWLSTIVVRTCNKLLRRRRLMARFGLWRPPEIDWEQVRSHGATMEERAALRRRTLLDCMHRGIADSSGRPQPHVEDAFEVLARAEVSLDSVQTSAPEAEARLVVAAALGGQGVLAVQDAAELYLEPVPADGLASAVVSRLPAAPRGEEKSVTVPLEQLLAGPGADFLQRRAAPPGVGGAAVDPERKALARLHAQERLRGGQVGANARSRDGGRSRMPVLSWFDTETGRYFTQASRGQDGRDWIVIAPADAQTLRHRLAEMLSSAMRATTAVL